MNTQQIIEYFNNTKKKYNQINSFSQSAGIYAIFFSGKSFPLFTQVKNGQLIYIGKTESSQEKRDAKTHFATGKTGSSTLRKSIGSILNEISPLNPIPRNAIDYQKGRKSHFKFDSESEETISKWMHENLSLAFFEFPKSKIELEDLESELIKLTCPILNLSKNTQNIYKNEIQALRSCCANKAHAITDLQIQKPKSTENKISTNKTTSQITSQNMSGSAIIDNITESDVSSNQIRIVKGNKHLFPAEKLGITETYDISLNYNGKDYPGSYKIGSKDGKSRSGILKSNILKELNFKAGSVFKINKLQALQYKIEVR